LSEVSAPDDQHLNWLPWAVINKVKAWYKQLYISLLSYSKDTNFCTDLQYLKQPKALFYKILSTVAYSLQLSDFPQLNAAVIWRTVPFSRPRVAEQREKSAHHNGRPVVSGGETMF